MKHLFILLSTLILSLNLTSCDFKNSDILTNPETQVLTTHPLSDYDLLKIDRSKLRLPKPKGNLPDYKLEQWVPRSMDFKGKLIKKWELESQDYSKQLSLNNAQSIPDGWRLNTYPAIAKVDNMILNPIDGNTIRPIKFGNNMIWMGLFADKYMFTSDDYTSESKIVCVDRFNWRKYWENGWEAMPSDQHTLIVNGCLIDCYFGPMFEICRLDHKTGEMIWGLRCKATGITDFITQYSSDDESLFILNAFRNNKDDNDQGLKVGREYRLVLYKVNPKDGSFVSKDLYHFDSNLESQPMSYIHYSKESLWVLTGDNNLLKVNPVSMEIENKYHTEKYDNAKVCLSSDYLILYNNNSHGQMVNLNNPSEIVGINQRFDIVSDRLQDFYPIYYGQLIIYTKDRINQITDNKMSSGWYIDSNDLNSINAKVIMQDWRGVLVKTDKKLICFGKP